MRDYYFPMHYRHIPNNQAHYTLIGTNGISTISQTSSESSNP